jgi:hypothetical protein
MNITINGRRHYCGTCHSYDLVLLLDHGIVQFMVLYHASMPPSIRSPASRTGARNPLIPEQSSLPNLHNLPGSRLYKRIHTRFMGGELSQEVNKQRTWRDGVKPSPGPSGDREKCSLTISRSSSPRHRTTQPRPGANK